MTEASWTGVILAYVCPTCHKEDRQKFVFEGATYDQTVLRKAVAQASPCKMCNSPLPKDLMLDTDICVATLEQLRKAGYPTPPVN